MSELRRGYGIFSIQVCKKILDSFINYKDGFLCLIIALAYLYLADQWLLYLTSLFFVPQIIHNALQGKRPKFDIFYIFFLGIVRTILPVIRNENVKDNLTSYMQEGVLFLSSS